jgi:hypothetical protein
MENLRGWQAGSAGHMDGTIRRDRNAVYAAENGLEMEVLREGDGSVVYVPESADPWKPSPAR